MRARLEARSVQGTSPCETRCGEGSRIFPHETLRPGQGDLLRQRCSLAGAAMVRCHTRSNFLSDAGGL